MKHISEFLKKYEGMGKGKSKAIAKKLHVKHSKPMKFDKDYKMLQGDAKKHGHKAILFRGHKRGGVKTEDIPF